jgi:hypothetical protein
MLVKTRKTAVLPFTCGTTTSSVAEVRFSGKFPEVNLHTYHYAGNNPVKLTDPTGRSSIDDLMAEFYKDKDPVVLSELGPRAYYSYGVFDPLGFLGIYQQNVFPGKVLEPLVQAFPWRFDIEKAYKKIYADYIGSGHAFTKHVESRGEFRDFGITTKEQFTAFIEGIMNNPSDYKKLSNGRDAFFDSTTGTTVIRNAGRDSSGNYNDPDRGTAYRQTFDPQDPSAFRVENAKAEFDALM